MDQDFECFHELTNLKLSFIVSIVLEICIQIRPNGVNQLNWALSHHKFDVHKQTPSGQKGIEQIDDRKAIKHDIQVPYELWLLLVSLLLLHFGEVINLELAPLLISQMPVLELNQKRVEDLDKENEIEGGQA